MWTTLQLVTKPVKRLKDSSKQSLTFSPGGGYKVKGFVSDGDISADALALLGSGVIGRVLGISWNTTTDELIVTTRINLSKKYKGDRTEPDLTYSEIPRILEIQLTGEATLE